MNAVPETKICYLGNDNAKFVAEQLARVPVTLAVGLAALLIAMVPSAGDWLQFHRTSIACGEVWRLATCHLTHWNAEHLQWDLLMFVVLGAAYASCEIRARCGGAWPMAASVVTGLVWCFFPEMPAYRGLSGIDTALFTLLAVELVRDARRDGNRAIALAAGGLLAGFAAKTLYEAATGQTFFVDQDAAGFAPLVWDHLAAAIVGAMLALGIPHAELLYSLPQRIWLQTRKNAENCDC